MADHNLAIRKKMGGYDGVFYIPYSGHNVRVITASNASTWSAMLQEIGPRNTL